MRRHKKWRIYPGGTVCNCRTVDQNNRGRIKRTVSKSKRTQKENRRETEK
ncbi:hypothetical protein [Mediterraneibacter gnavus]|uniref:Uncharacterized protein n=1 Tax=Mediterraneibacter gnavus TaxID=33038 RepID=A0AAJ3FGJ8_MEDGN|nr:hypothetical protein [Mediterraneibacter gnavus]MDU4756115.1 hypothetical protein [Lachnospiraceae bacterium]NSC84154.1 hypothetical protein [Mediterraneibacter gnavus]NSI27011.1 hypothetical protein [Mediterraneibacter gnavus]NSI30600.1 hypothetical protein [Mediterraneibacter gnavus]NSI46442.1 hypothetical protein [Mediterraneibacter gnavus]